MRNRLGLVAAMAVALSTTVIVGVAPTATASSRPRLVNPGTGLPIGELPTVSQRAKAQRELAANPRLTGTPHLNYYGGPVVSNPAVVSVLWGQDPNNATQTYLPQVTGAAAPTLDSWFSHVSNSAYMSWLNEYNTTVANGTGQQVGYGTFVGRYQLPYVTPSATNTVYDSLVQSQLLSNIANGSLPAPTLDAKGYPNTIYAVFFPKNVVLQDPNGNQSGVQFCAYHSSVTYAGKQVPYLVLPDPTSNGMSNGCGTNPNYYQNLQSYVSHELIEAQTDADVAIATNYAAPLGWYDPQGTNGEIGDICNQSTGSVLGTDNVTYTVQKEWSNASAACIAQKSTSVPGSVSDLASAAATGPTNHLTWTPPADGGSQILSYTLYRSLQQGLIGSSYQTLAGSSTSYDDTSITPGNTYYYTLVASNVYGPGGNSNQASAVVATTAAAPGTPTATVSGANAIQVAWTGSPSDGGSAITGWNVYRYDTADPAGVLVGSTLAATMSFADTGLTTGTSYSYAVTAVNGIGESLPSAVSNSVVAQSYPDAPTNVAATLSGPGTVTVTWTAPGSDGGTPLTDYRMFRSESASDIGSPIATIMAGQPLQFVDAGLAAGTVQYYTVEAENQWGAGANSNVSQVTIATTPDAPTSVVASPGNNGTVVLTWAAPATNGGHAITGYHAVAVGASQSCTTQVTTCTITGLVVGRSYTFTVYATNDLGQSPVSTASNTVTPRTVPTAPRSLRATYAIGHKTTVTWSAPSSNGGATITAYYVRWSANGKLWTGWTSVGKKTSAIHVGFKKGVNGYVQVVAGNVAGKGAIAKLTVKPTK